MKTSITMLRNAAKSYGCDLKEGETGEVDSSLAKQLIKDKIAVPFDGATLKGISDAPDIAGGDDAPDAPEAKKGRKTKTDE